MERVFSVLVYNSMLAVPLVAAILLLRVMIRKLPKIYIHILWLLVLIELVVPPLASSPLGLKAQWNGSGLERTAVGDLYGGPAFLQNILQVPGTGMGIVPEENGNVTGEEGNGSVNGTDNHMDGEDGGKRELWSRVAALLSWVWAAGVCLLLTVYLLQFLRLKRKTATAVRLDKNIWEMGRKDTPFVLPGVPSRIFLAAGLEDQERRDILAHESTHIKYGDPWVRVFSCLVLALHWFNPMVWIAVHCLGKDMEMLCDERVLKGKTLEERKRYSETLLHFSVRRSGISPALSFGESNTESRIRHILYSKRPKLVISALLILVIAVCAVVFLTTSRQASGSGQPDGVSSGTGGERAAGDDDDQVQNAAGNNTGNNVENNGGESGQSGRTELERQDEREHWMKMPVVGEAYSPDADMLDKLEAAEDYTSEERWGMFPLREEGMDGTEAGQALHNAINLIAKTDNFRLYGTDDTESMILEVPDGKYIRMEIPFTSNYRFQPRLQELDYDGDGKNELSVVIYVLHGTGVSVQTLLMADSDSEGEWQIYQYLDDNYLEELSGLFLTEKTKEGAMLLVEGQAVGRIDRFHPDEPDYQYYAGSQIAFETATGSIVMKAYLEGLSSQSVIGDFSMGHELDVEVVYQDGGRWGLGDVVYHESTLEERVHNTAFYYYKGDEKGLNETCAAQGVKLNAAGGSDGTHENVEVRRIIYSAEDVKTGKVSAVAEILPEGGDSYDYLNLELVFEEEADGEGSWKVKDIMLEK